MSVITTSLSKNPKAATQEIPFLRVILNCRRFLLPGVLTLGLSSLTHAGNYTPGVLNTDGNYTNTYGGANDPDKVETIPLQATIQLSPPQISILTYAPGTFTINRKDPSAKTWTQITSGLTLTANGTWTDSNVVAGQMYEYQFVNTASTTIAPYTSTLHASGYILTGINVDQTQPKGLIAVIVASDLPTNLPAEYTQYKADLVADGWQVREIQVPRAANYNGLGLNSLSAVTVTTGGTTSLANGGIVRLANSSGSNALGTLSVSGTTITRVAIPAGGAGENFAIGDTLTISGGSVAGSGASLQATVTGTSVALNYGYPLTGGTGYTNKQAVTLTGQTSGATVQVTINVNSNGTISSFTIPANTTGFTSGEALTMTGNTTGSGVGPLTASLSSGNLNYVNLYAPGTGYVAGETGTLTGVSSSKTAQVTLSVFNGYLNVATIVSADTGFTNGELLSLSGTSVGTGAGLFAGSYSSSGQLQSVSVSYGGTGYINGTPVQLVNGASIAQATLNVTGTSVASVTVNSSTGLFPSGGSLSILPIYKNYVLTVAAPLDNSNAGHAVNITSGGSGYIDNDTVTIKDSSGNTAVGSIIVSGGAITGISVVLPSTFTAGQALTFTPASGGTGAAATVGPTTEDHILIRSAVQALYNTYAGQLKNVVMVGKVPVCRSGISDGVGSDGHGNECAYGVDAFYAEMLGVIGSDWTDISGNSSSPPLGDYNLVGDKQFDQQSISQINIHGTGGVQLGFGRIDLSQTIQTELEGERTFFNKLHRYKISDSSFRPGLNVCDRLSYANEREADLQAMPGVVGMNNINFITMANLPTVKAGQDSDQAYSAQHGPFLFYFKGSGGPAAGVGGKAVFWTGMQSHWGYWYQTTLQSSGSNSMQSRLAEDSFTLDFTWNIWGMRYIYHRMGMGLDAGDMMKQSINNQGWTTGPYTYKFNNGSDGDYHGVLYMDQMGDPAMRLFMFPPPSLLSVVKTGGVPVLNWTASTDTGVIGYHIYRAASANAPFTRLTTTPITGTTYTDSTTTSGSYVYMVRAIRLETTGGGTFYNPSLGITQSIDLGATPSVVSISTSSIGNAFWNTPTSYTLAAQGGVPQYSWSVISGTLPPGMSFSALGVLSGTPTAVGSYNFTVQVADQINQTAIHAYSLVVGSNSSNVLYPEATTYSIPTAPPNNSYGTSEISIVSGSAGNTPVDEAFQRYDLSGLATNNAVAKATVYLYVTSGTATGVYAPIQANMIADSANGWVDLGVSKFFAQPSSAGAGKTLIPCPGHGFISGTQITLAGLTGAGNFIGPYAITVVDADNFTIPVSFSSGWTYDPALSFVTTLSMTYGTRPTVYDTNVPTLTGTGTATPGTLIQFDVTSYVKEALANFADKKVGIRFFTGTPQSISFGSLRSFGGSIPYMVIQTTNAPSIVFNSPTVNPATVYTGSSLYLNTTVTAVSPRTATIQWSKVSGPGNVAFTNPTAATTGATFSAPGDYVIQIAADDGVAQSYQTLTVRVTSTPVNGPISSLVLRMPFDETTGTVAGDLSGVSPANNGTLKGSPLPTWGNAGIIGNALSFAGTGQRVEIPSATGLDGGQQMSISLWFNANSMPVGSSLYNALVSKRTGSFSKESYGMAFRGGTTGTLSTLYCDIGGKSVAGSALSSNKWYHLVMVFDGTQATNNLQIYVNGAPDKFGTIFSSGTIPLTTVPSNSTSNLYIGAYDGNDAATFNGRIDEVRIYNTALTLAQVQDLYAAVPTNIGPVISTSPTLSGTVNVSMPLTATVTGNNEPVGTVLTYNWSQLSGPNTLTIGSPTSLTTATTPSLSGTYGLQFMANDGAITTYANITALVTGQNYASWTVQKGLTGNNALETATLQPDKLTNLYKYALGLDPATDYNPGAAGLPSVQPQSVSGNNYLSLTFTGTATDLTYVVQAASDLTGMWTTIQSFGPGSAPGTVTVQDTQPITSSTQRYMRLQIKEQ